MNVAVCHCQPKSDISDFGHLIVTNSGKPEFVKALSLLAASSHNRQSSGAA
jgi:hypothetical protein